MTTRTMIGVVAASLLATTASAQDAFVNWESPHVNPIAMTPDGARVLAVNTADNRLEVFGVSAGDLVHVASVPVGLDPVSVRVRTNDEVWVVNHISDTVSIVDLTTFNVTATIPTGDEPTDIVFAGDPERAFVSVSQLNQVMVFDPASLATDPIVIEIEGEDPRALATDGVRVYAAIFEAGNNTTILGSEIVSTSVNPYPGNPNPPPNAGAGFEPPIAPGLPAMPAAALIVKKLSDGTWQDENAGDWSPAVTWDLHGHDLAVIDASTLAVSYVFGVLNTNMNLAVSPVSGDVALVGLNALNHLRFEPNINGTFARVEVSMIASGASTPSATVDLNPHLDYSTPTIPAGERATSIGDPRGVVWGEKGDAIYVTGMGSNNVVALDTGLGRTGRVDVGEGPTGLVAAGGRLYILNKFEGSVSIVDTTTLTETGRIGFYDPTPDVIKIGRPFLYDTHRTSGLGHLACASCHVDARMDQIAWDLGDPSGEMKPFNQVCNFGVGGCEDWHPVKGPMMTQTLIGILETGPLHWRADREDLAAFNGAFLSLMGDDEELTIGEMQQFEDFVATLTPGPNPFRNLDHTLSATVPNGGNADQGKFFFDTITLDGFLSCEDCHAFPTGTNGELTSAALILDSQSMKIAQMRNLFEKTGFDTSSANNNRGFGFTHDGAVDSLLEFLEFPGFEFSGGEVGDAQRRHVEAFLLSFSTDTHAGVGAQATIGGAGPDQTALRDELVAIANTAEVGLVAKGIINGEHRGYTFLGGATVQSDRASESVSILILDLLAGPGSELTYTLVPLGSQVRIGIDRDEDGFFDADELDACTNPADPTSFPGDGRGGCDTCVADLDGSGSVGFEDLLVVLSNWGACVCAADLDEDGAVAFSDLLLVLSAWGVCP